jgi:hypothetical protein
MRRLSLFVSLVVFCLAGSPAFAQNLKGAAGRQTRLPLKASEFTISTNSPIKPTHMAFNRLSASTNAAVQNSAASSPLKVRSIPTFSGSFAFQGTTFPFTMVGRAPQKGGTTEIDTSYLAISFFFDEFVDQNGNNIVIDATANTKNLLNGPDFASFPYTTGDTQFSDAVQRAEFFNVVNSMDESGPWHTLLEPPRQLTPITVEVPFYESLVFQLPDGAVFAVIDVNFLTSQLNTLLQTEELRVDEIPIFVTHNAIYGDFFAGNPLDCCVGGFHTAVELGQSHNTVLLQVFAFATSLDAEISNAVFGDPTAFADVEPLSHELTETFNDPFVNNAVPRWANPASTPFISCSSSLETGDPVEGLPNPSFPVMIGGFLYHPQTEALLQWFSRQTPSSAIGGAYSYPGNNLTSPSTACPPGQ